LQVLGASVSGIRLAQAPGRYLKRKRPPQGPLADSTPRSGGTHFGRKRVPPLMQLTISPWLNLRLSDPAIGVK